MKTSRGAKARDVLRLFYFVCRHLFCSLFSKLRLCSVRGRNRPWLVSWIISLSRSAHPTIFWPYYYELDLFNNFITESIANAFHCVFVCSFSGCFHFVYYLTWEIVSLLFYVSSFTFVESSIISSITFCFALSMQSTIFCEPFLGNSNISFQVSSCYDRFCSQTSRHITSQNAV